MTATSNLLVFRDGDNKLQDRAGVMYVENAVWFDEVTGDTQGGIVVQYVDEDGQGPHVEKIPDADIVGVYDEVWDGQGAEAFEEYGELGESAQK